MKTSWIMLWPFSLLTKHSELLKLPREPQFLNGSSHTEEQSKLYQCWQVYIPHILSTWHSYTTAAQSWVNPKLSYRHQPPELLTKTPTSFKWPTKKEAGYSLIKTSIPELDPRGYCTSVTAYKKNFTPINFSQNEGSQSCLGICPLLSSNFKLKMVSH